jgi:hypothetical protein
MSAAAGWRLHEPAEQRDSDDLQWQVLALSHLNAALVHVRFRDC